MLQAEVGGAKETVLLPCHRADWVVLWRIRICGFTSFYIQEERDAQMFPAFLVMVVFGACPFLNALIEIYLRGSLFLMSKM